MSRVLSAISFLYYYASLPSCCGIKSSIVTYVAVSSILVLVSSFMGICEIKDVNLNKIGLLHILHNCFSLVNLIWAGFSFGNTSVIGLVFSFLGSILGINGGLVRFRRRRSDDSGQSLSCGSCCSGILFMLNTIAEIIEICIAAFCFSNIGEEITFPAYGKESHHFYALNDPLECSLFLNYTGSFTAFDGNEIDEYCMPHNNESEYSACCVWNR